MLKRIQEEAAERRAKILELLNDGGKTIDDLMKDFNESEGKVTSALRTLREWGKIHIGRWDKQKAVFVLGLGDDAGRDKVDHYKARVEKESFKHSATFTHVDIQRDPLVAALFGETSKRRAA